MAEMTEAKIEDACKTPVADHVRRFWELVRTQGAVLRVDTPNPLGYDTACFGPPVAAFLASAWTTDQSKGGDANADLSATSGIQTSPDATSPGRECEPAGANEELCRRLEAAADSCDEERFRSFRRKYWITIADTVRKAANLIRTLERERDEAREERSAKATDDFDAREGLRERARRAESRATAAEAKAESWKNQFHSAAEAASMYVEFYEQHHADFDPAGNYIPHSQIDGDLRAVEAEATDLRGQLDAAHSLIGLNATEIDALKSEAERLRAALKPFADRASRYDPDDNDNNEPDWCTAAPSIRIGDLRRARTALEGK